MAQFLVTVRSKADLAASAHLYLLDGALDAAALDQLVAVLLHDPVVQQAAWTTLDALTALVLPAHARCVEVAYLPGVTDNEAESVRLGAERLGLPSLRVVRTLRRHMLDLPEANGAAALRDIANPIIQTTLISAQDDVAARRQFYAALLRTPDDVVPHVGHVALRTATDDELLRISRVGILALDLEEMRAIQAFYCGEGREPTDGELETLAQTWSEHCSHKTFKARVRYRGNSKFKIQNSELATDKHHTALSLLESAPEVEINSLIKTFLIKATDEILAQRAPDKRQATTDTGRPAPDPRTPIPESWVLSAFVDNAGIIAFGSAHEVAIKVETHNHPSALEPFGGANTGVGGVVRDILGVSAQPIANTDVLCFGPLDLPVDALADGLLHPRTIAAGVVAGVRDYGNKLGIPTVNGAVLYERGYTANPLVFCGTVGIAPRGKNPHTIQPGDAVVLLGGRTGRDGIHGATFSSVELTHTTAHDVGTAVQIGDPITEKKTLDIIMQARDAGLYSGITDCGAGGLSSAVGEIGAETGVRVALDDVPLKYAGLQPWEIWLSEAQERMVLAVPPATLGALLALAAHEDVEATVIGQFTGDGRLTVTHGGATVVDLAMAFLHDGRPQRVLEAVWNRGQGSGFGDQAEPRTPNPDPGAALLRLLAHPNIASKEAIIRTYDHEVGGRTVIKPLVGVAHAGPGDAAVLQPLRTSFEGLALGSGINPRYGTLDPYWMALAVVDEALRNVVAVGGDPARTILLDNFCWGDPRIPDRMAGLVRACAGCYDAALAYGTPFISGKDSLNNEYRDALGQRHAIPPTLLITALAHVADVGQSVTMDLKAANNQIYLVGLTKAELGGGHLADVLQQAPDAVSQATVPHVDLATAPRILGAVHAAIRAGLVCACHDLSEGGLAVAAAEMAFAGGFGMRIDLACVPASGALDHITLLFAESPTRFLVEVQPHDAAAFGALLAGVPHVALGITTVEPQFVVARGDAQLISTPIADLQAAWQSTVVA